MAVGKEIRTKIKSIQNTQKITKAMEMVAASKMRKAQDRMHAARPYSDKIHNVIVHLAHAHTEYRHFYLDERPIKRVGYIVISTDRGLCGGLNTNMFRAIINDLKKWHNEGIDVDFCTIGTKAGGFFKRLRGNIVAGTSHLGDAPGAESIFGPVKVMLDAYSEGKIDRLFLVANEFINTMVQKPAIAQLVPIVGTEEKEISHHWDYIYEPDAKEILDTLMTRYIESLTYRAVIENIACEMAARMIAMKSATDNAGNLIDELQLVYNKARQAAITQEIAEIVGGAAAV